MSAPSPPGAQDTFETERPRLTGLAYRMTGSLADADDVMQEAWIRWAARDVDRVDNPAGWLTTVTSRLALDRLRAQRRRREEYLGPWLPDPVPTDLSVEETAELAESLSVGFLILLDSLGPYERVAFLLGEIFGEPYPVIATVLGKSEPASRQLVSRARRKLRSAQSNGEGHHHPSAASGELLKALMASVLAGDEAAVLKLLDPDVVLISDAGPARRAARVPIVGAQRVQRQAMEVWRRLGLSFPSNWQSSIHILEVNSSPSIVLNTPEGPIVVTAEAIHGRITSIWLRLNPDKTAALRNPPHIL